MPTWTRRRSVLDGHWEDTYDVELLWTLTEPLGIEYCPMSEFRHAFSEPCWVEHDNEGRELLVRPVDVTTNPTAHPRHAAKIEAAKLSYPILVTATLEPFVIDGMHRLCKAEAGKWQMMPVKYVDSQLLEKALVFSRFYAKI